MLNVKTLEGKTIDQAILEICSNADDIVKGGIIGMLRAFQIVPSMGLNISTVIDAEVNGKKTNGYTISLTNTIQEANLSYDELCKIAVFQQFIGVNEEGRAVLFVPLVTNKPPETGYLN